MLHKLHNKNCGTILSWKPSKIFLHTFGFEDTYNTNIYSGDWVGWDQLRLETKAVFPAFGKTGIWMEVTSSRGTGLQLHDNTATAYKPDMYVWKHKSPPAIHFNTWSLKNDRAKP